MGTWPSWWELDRSVHGGGGWHRVAHPVVLAATVLLYSAHSAQAQTTAMLQGRVVDSSGAVLPGATITVRNPAIGFQLSIRTDPAGRYDVAALPSGPCTVRAEAPGFRAKVIGARNVDAGRTLVRDAFRGEASSARVPLRSTPAFSRRHQ